MTTFPLLFFQAKSNFSNHTSNNIDRIGDILEFRLSVTQQALAQLSRSSFIINALVDSSGREVYLGPTLRDFNLPIDIPVKLTLFDSNIVPFAGNTAGYADSDIQLRKLATESLKTQQPRFVVHKSGRDNLLVLAFPVFYPPAADYEGVLLAVIDAEQLFILPQRAMDASSCLTIAASSGHS